MGYQSWGFQGETVEILYFGPLFCKIVLSHKLFCHLLNYAFDFVIMGFGTHREGNNGQMWRSHTKLLKNLARGLKIEIFKALRLDIPPTLGSRNNGPAPPWLWPYFLYCAMCENTPSVIVDVIHNQLTSPDVTHCDSYPDIEGIASTNIFLNIRERN